ncbi:hypothetical protein ACIPW5_11330 [Streptomyces sp. NPDC090077]
MPESADALRAEALEWRESAALADSEGKPDLARVCRAEAVACEKAAETR